MWTCNFHFQTLDLCQCSNQTGAPSKYGKDEQNKVSPHARRAWNKTKVTSEDLSLAVSCTRTKKGMLSY
jgi:hypothetical protein